MNDQNGVRYTPSYDEWRAEQPCGPSMYGPEWDTENICEHCGRPTFHGTGECEPRLVGMECRPRSNHGREIAPYLTDQDIEDGINTYQNMLQDLRKRKITPRSVIGTGYTNPRKTAEEWIQNRIYEYREEKVHRQYP